MSSGCASAQAPGFDSGSTIGAAVVERHFPDEASEKAPEQAVAPMRTVAR